MSRLTLFFFAGAIMFASVGCSVEAQDAYGLVRAGQILTSDEISALEREVEQDPEDIVSRTKLLGYYFAQYGDQAARKAREKHVLWLIEYAPDIEVVGLPYGQLDAIRDADGYAQAKEAWLKHIERTPENLLVLNNASAFFTLHDRELAIDSLEKAYALDADNPKWPEKLGQIHSLAMHTNSAAERKKAAKTALDYYETALGLSTKMGRSALLVELSKTALEAEEIAKARGYAKQMLKHGGSDWNAGNTIHHGNLVLGRVAMRSGETNEAKKYLLAAGRTTGSPQLNSFGPNMTLALELLEAGESDVVLEYFDLCSKFWAREELGVWADDVGAGRTPGFGANLDY